MWVRIYVVLTDYYTLHTYKETWALTSGLETPEANKYGSLTSKTHLPGKERQHRFEQQIVSWMVENR